MTYTQKGVKAMTRIHGTVKSRPKEEGARHLRRKAEKLLAKQKVQADRALRQHVPVTRVPLKFLEDKEMKQKPENPIFVSKAEERRFLMKKKQLAEERAKRGTAPKCLDPNCMRCNPGGEKIG